MDRKLTVSALVGIALISKNIGDGCIAIPQLDYGYYIDLPHSVNMPCYVSSFKPEHPETKGMMAELPIYSADQVTASGTASSLASLSSLKYS